jgi:hypothetical protein
MTGGLRPPPHLLRQHGPQQSQGVQGKHPRAQPQTLTLAFDLGS